MLATETMISIIAAISKNNVIGAANDLPWDIPEDRQRFKKLTMGKPVIMGRKTFESIFARLGRALPGRKNIVITRNNDFEVPAGTEKYGSLEEALEAHKNDDVFIIGGGEIYSQSMGLSDTLYITHVDKEVRGDTYFPEIDPGKWIKTEEESHEGYSFATYKRK